MKYRMKFNYAMSIILLLWLVLGFSSCVKEDLIQGFGQTDYSSVSIRIKTPEPVVNNAMSRALASNFDVIENMNIIIATREGTIKDRIYISDFTAEMPTYNNITITKKGNANDGTIEVEVKFDEPYWETKKDLPLNSCQFYAVANRGEITVNQDNGKVSDLKNLSINATMTDGHCFIPTPNAMFGQISKEWTAPISADKPGEVCRYLEIGLQRTAAMFTIEIDGSGLDDGVLINLQSVALHNVPTSCTLGVDNVVTQPNDKLKPKEGAVSAFGDFKGGIMISGGSTLAKTITETTNPFYNYHVGSSSKIGKHYDETNPDYSAFDVHPMFMYENIHGETFGQQDVTEQKWKRPAGIAQDVKAIDDNSAACSYMEVKAKYTRYKNEGGTISMGETGDIAWRFFLGGDKDVLTNFDVKRNTYYRVTLTLSGSTYGELADGASWRITKETEVPKVVGDADMVVGGGGEMFGVEFINTQNDNMKLRGTFVPNNNTFVYVYQGDKNKAGWYYPGEENVLSAVTVENQMWFYTQPFLPDMEPLNINERKAIVEFRPTSESAPPVATVTFTQYRPVTFSITQNDLDTYRNKNEEFDKICNMIENYYGYDVDKGDFVFYVDRVDRDPMPWGFDGVQLDKNMNTGFENVYHLIAPLEVGDNCDAHKEYAKHYLPSGKGFRKETPDDDTYGGFAGKVDYSNGSCMMHAAMENYFQEKYSKNTPPFVPTKDVTPTTLLDVRQTGLPSSRPQAGTTDYTFAWCVPSIVGYQLMEKMDRFYKDHGIKDRGFDPQYPISKWISYWTSNATTKDIGEEGKYPATLNIDGKHRSFVYQFGMGLDALTESDLYPAYYIVPRNTAITYRLINIDPKFIASQNQGN